MNRIRVGFLTLTLTLLVGCGAGAGSPKAGPTPTSPTSPTASVTPTATPTAKPTLAARIPQGWRVTTAKKAGLRFALPRTWTKLDASKLKDPALKSRMEQFAKGLGVTPNQLQQVFKQIDLMAISPTVTKDAYAEVEVIPLPVLAELPTREAIRAQLEALHGVRIIGFRDIQTPVGKGVATSVRKVVPGIGSVVSDGVFVLLDSGVVGLTLTAATPQRASLLIDKMIASFSDVGSGGAVGNGSSVDG